MNTLVTLNEVQTNITTWGEPFNSKGGDVIICISGNPGIVGFYTQFGASLHKNTKLPVCVIGHAGHDEVPDKRSNQLKNQEHLFNLDGQIKHKIDLITNHINKESKIHFVGHSIGSWFILELLQQNEILFERISSVSMLFPTVQRMAETTSGRFINGFVRNSPILTTLMYIILYIMPELILKQLVNLYMKFKKIPDCYINAIMTFMKPKILEKILFLAFHEMDRVRALNVKIIERIKSKTLVLYSPNDGWVPLYYMEDFRRFQPTLEMKELNVEHAFVIHSSERVAELVSDFIKPKISDISTHNDNIQI